jgi:hypothetical protein
MGYVCSVVYGVLCTTSSPFIDAITKIFLWYMHMHCLMGMSPIINRDAVGNSLTPLNLNILAHNGGDEDKEVIMTLLFHTHLHANYLFRSLDIPLTGMTSRSLLQHPQSLVQAPQL